MMIILRAAQCSVILNHMTQCQVGTLVPDIPAAGWRARGRACEAVDLSRSDYVTEENTE